VFTTRCTPCQNCNRDQHAINTPNTPHSFTHAYSCWQTVNCSDASICRLLGACTDDVQENERLAEEVDQMRTGGRAANAREYRSEAGNNASSSCCQSHAARHCAVSVVTRTTSANAPISLRCSCTKPCTLGLTVQSTGEGSAVTRTFPEALLSRVADCLLCNPWPLLPTLLTSPGYCLQRCWTRWTGCARGFLHHVDCIRA
jgi:hypothetical protein